MDSFTTSFIHFSKGDEHLSLPYLVGNKTHEEHYKSHKKIKIKMLKKSDILPKIASIITVGIIILSVAMVYVAYIIV